MISFFICIAILIIGYAVYSRFIDKTFGADDRVTPAVRLNDGSDYVVMPEWKLFLVQLLNIAGLRAGIQCNLPTLARVFPPPTSRGAG